MQLLVEAYDLGDPSRTSSTNATVTINVQRNRAPVFTSSSYGFTMREDATVGSQTLVGQVIANDPDTAVSILCVRIADHLNYFTLNLEPFFFYALTSN